MTDAGGASHHAGATHVCPWWFTYVFDNPVRRLFQDPVRILDGLVRPGQHVLDLGCGMGYFALGAAQLVGDGGMVHAVDLQGKSLDVLMRRAARAGLDDRILTHCAHVADLELTQPADVAYAMWMVHEVDRRADFARGLRRHLRPGANLLIAEPKIHVGQQLFQRIVGTFRDAGFEPVGRPRIRLSRATVLTAPGAE